MMAPAPVHHTISIGDEAYKIPPILVPPHPFVVLIYDPYRQINLGVPVTLTGWSGPLAVAKLNPAPNLGRGFLEMTVEHREPDM